MNGRMYDPVVGRMLSVDNFVQEVRNSQSYNRYSYVVNNPLKYNDPSGEFFRPWLNFTLGFYSGLINGDGIAESVRSGCHRASNGMRISAGIFATDPNQPFLARGVEYLSRITWQAPQTLIGYANAHFYNTFGLGGGVESVNTAFGALSIQTRGRWGGITMSNVILGDRNLRTNANNALFQHEYGHYLQSKRSGPAYFVRYGLPSITSEGNHDFHFAEKDANRRAFIYFNREVIGFQDDASRFDNLGWNFGRNPLDLNNSNAYDDADYFDWQNDDPRRLDILRTSARWFDYASWLIPLSGPLLLGIIH
jgi:hypothetical protein